uniref:non-specific serine/threonine protein kinase n=1 Tax=Clastoptera arizonana TaxID=38151 RepID=A0A1B6CHR9_9HEMI
MNALGLSIIMRMGCFCTKEVVTINNQKYYVCETLGEGGFSMVYLVENTRTRKRYALKKIVCHGREDQKAAMEEISYHKSLDHKNVIRCLDSTVTGSPDPVLNTTSEVLLLLPYYGKGTLANELERRKVKSMHMEVTEVLKIFIEICEGVKAFHEAKPVPLSHRDIKTANILLDVDNSPILMDLGSVAPASVKVCGSTEAQHLQDIASERCSMPYRAPELFNVESYCMIDQRTDIWSLGCVLYAMCYFKSPFDAVYERGDSVALAVISGNISFPDITPYPEEIHELISAMLKVNPMERPYIYTIIEKSQDTLAKIKGIV